MRVLIVDDDAAFRALVVIALEGAGIETEAVEDVPGAIELLERESRGAFDLILLDVDMPGPKGWDLLSDLRRSGDEIPVIFVTGNQGAEDTVKGLRLGADDYVTKPVEFDVLIARMETVLRRRSMLEPIRFGDFDIDLVRRKVRRAGSSVDLSPREFDLLLALARAEGEVVERAMLLEQVWDLTFDPQTNVLDVHIGRLRRKLDRHGRPCIETVRGKGYRLVKHDRPAETR